MAFLQAHTGQPCQMAAASHRQHVPLTIPTPQMGKRIFSEMHTLQHCGNIWTHSKSMHAARKTTYCSSSPYLEGDPYAPQSSPSIRR